MTAKITIADPNAPNNFEIELETGATDEEQKLKQLFDETRKDIQDADKPGTAELLQRLLSAARIALVGLDGKAPNVRAGLMSLGAIKADLARLKLPVGRFRVSLPGGDPPRSPRDIEFAVLNENRAEPIPAEQLTLKSDIENTLTTLQVIFPERDPVPSTICKLICNLGGDADARSATTRKAEAENARRQGAGSEAVAKITKPADPPGVVGGQPVAGGDTPQQRRFEEYQLKLKSLARVGLEGDASPDTARLALIALQNEILQREGPRIKNAYMRRLGLWALAFGGATAIGYMVIRNNHGFSFQFATLKNLFLLWTGTMIGTWLSFGIRKPAITMRDLSALESDMVEPPLRLLFTGLIAITFAFIFLTGMVNVEIGSLNSAQLLAHGSTALVIGLLFGVSEQVLPGALTRRASQFVSEVAGK